VEGVTGGKMIWATALSGYYSFSLRNRLRENVRNVHYYVIFYDAEDDPIDVEVAQYKELIPAGLAKRVTPSFGVHSSVRELTKRVEFRVLDFEIMQ
jgi:hypothetical protein